jgi:putative ABC transport system permease protein
MTGIVQDFRYALRGLKRAPGFTVVVVFTLALGIGANAAMFGVIRAVLLKPLPYRDPARLVQLGQTRSNMPNYSGAISAPDFLDWQQRNTVFERMAAVSGGAMTLTASGGDPVWIIGLSVSPSYFDVFGVPAELGRTFAPDEGQSHVVVLSHRLWASQFGADPNIIGRKIRLDREEYTAIAVMPRGIAVDPFDPALWTPSDFRQRGDSLGVAAHIRGFHDLNRVVARLKPGITLAQARSQMDAIAARLALQYPASNTGWGISVQSWPRPIGQDVAQSLYVLLAAVGAVLLIACANLAHLTLARGTARTREMAIRAALGARRARLVRQVFLENFIVAILGGVCGLAIGRIGLLAIERVVSSMATLNWWPADTTIRMDPYVWSFGTALTIISGVAFGLPPALAATRPSINRLLTQAGPRVRSGRSQRVFHQWLVVIEVAAAFTLLASAGLLIRSVITLKARMNVGFDSTDVLTAGLPIAAGRFANTTALNAYLDEVASHIQSVPGVRDVAFTEGLPLQGSPFLRSFQVTDRPVVERSLRPYVPFKAVSPSYFRALGLRVLTGRPLNDNDQRQSPLALVVNDTFARTYLPGANAIGTRLLVKERGSFEKDAVWEVVGVVADEGISAWTRAREPMLYATRQQDGSGDMALIVRGAVTSVGFRRAIQAAVSQVDPDQALTKIERLTDLDADIVAPDRVRSTLLTVFAAIAAALAAIGLYGVLSHSAAQRRQEIGIRAALGATSANVIGLVVGEGMALTVWGLALGLVGVIGARQLLITSLVGVVPLGSIAVVGIAGVLTLVALLACYVPARRAARVDPLVALRYE